MSPERSQRCFAVVLAALCTSCVWSFAWYVSFWVDHDLEHRALSGRDLRREALDRIVDLDGA
jgi:hypothetical protein